MKWLLAILISITSCATTPYSDIDWNQPTAQEKMGYTKLKIIKDSKGFAFTRMIMVIAHTNGVFPLFGEDDKYYYVSFIGSEPKVLKTMKEINELF